MSKLRYLTSGESHGQGLTVIVEGIPADLVISQNYIENHMARRQKGYGSGGRMKIEKDKALIKSGVRHGKTLGSPIALWIENKDFANWNEAMSIEEVSDDVDKKVFTKVVPGHADFPGALKYNQTDLRNILERASARETAARVAAGSIARKFLEHFGISIHSRVISVGSKKSKKLNYENIDWDFIENSDVRANDPDSETKFKEEIDLAKSQRTTVGGIFQVITYGVPVGLGSHVHWDRKLDGQIGQSILSINAVKGVEIGNGFENTTKKGKEVHDVIIPDKNNIKNFKHISNHAGGIEGGMTNGEPIIVNVAIKPIATMTNPLPSVDINTGEIVEAAYNRSDICQVSRACPIGESMIALTLANSFLEKFGGDSMLEIQTNYTSYTKTHKNFGSK
ncbi:MAG: chorismate synthase [Chloroflexi bacterium]|nr:chorismate synthase [Chloroflexota bacterium]|tara:strand:- start:9163 stop:10344 length:1182 start_codon:yes stop_codon:yes gene_type:complete